MSKHAEDAIQEQEIRREWIDQTMADPLATELDPDDPELRYALRPIADFGYRVLRERFQVRVFHGNPMPCHTAGWASGVTICDSHEEATTPISPCASWSDGQEN